MGTYTFTSDGLMDIYGCFYAPSFDPSHSSQNLIKCDRDSGGYQQFLINESLEDGASYVLVVTSYAGADTGTYEVTAMGPSVAYMAPVPPSGRK